MRKLEGSAASNTRLRVLRAGLTAVAGFVLAATTVMPPTHAATVGSGVPEGNPYTTPFEGARCKIGVVGDIAGSSSEVTKAKAVKAMMDANGVGHYLLPGDLAYTDGTVAQFDAYFAPVYGFGNPAKNRPIPGNHEWRTPGASGYYDHAFPGVPQNYAYDACGWRVVSVDAESAAQVTAAAAFIRSEDAKRPDQPTAIQWHRPRWSSNNRHGSDVNRQALWQAAVDTKAAFVINAHEHAYERFAPLDAAGQPAADGVPQFVIGTGGRPLSGVFTPLPGSQSRLGTYYGAGIFELFDDGRWSMEFRDTTAPTGIVRDSASGVSATLEPATSPTPAPSPSPSPLPTTSTRTYAPVADATVVSASPNRNYGSTTTLEVDSSPVEQSLMKFTVEGTAGYTVTSATLRLYVTNPGPSGGRFFRTAGTGWSESTVNWNTAPAADPTPFASHGPVTSGTWVEVDAAALVDGDGTYSIRTTGASSDGAGYGSKEAASNQPHLVLTMERLDLTPPSAITDLRAVPVDASRIELDWTDAVDDTAVAGYRVQRDGVDSGTTITESAYADTGLAPSTTYLYTVTAVDAAGNASGPSNVVSATTPPAAPVTLTFAPVADASIMKTYGTTAYGKAAGLDADGSPVQQFLMRFDVAGSAGRTVTSAKLRLYVTNPSPAGGDFFPVADDTWSETSVTYNNAPAAGTTRLATLGAVTTGSWAEVDLGSHITGDGTYSLRVTSTHADGATYSSKEAATNKPHLVLTYG